DLALAAGDAVCFRHAAQEPRVQGRVDVISVVQDLVREHGEPAVPRGKPFLAVFAELLADTQFQSLEPEVLEPARPAILTRPPEGMNVVLADVAPVLERDAELERALDGHHEIPLVDLQ